MVEALPFGTLLKQYRLARNLTHKNLSAASGVSGRAISNLERGANRRPRAETVLMLADGLRLVGIERDRLLTAARGWPLADPEPPTGPHNLPQDLPGFIGRERDIALVRTLVRQHRFVTLTGTGGCGKTRLALEAARGLLTDFADGVFLVDLAPLRDPSLVASAIARVLDVKESGRSSIEERLYAHLHGKSLLLVLDNFEHLLPAAPLIMTLLAHCPSVKVLVTSRAKLRCLEEVGFLVPPLDLPDRRQHPSPQALASYEATALFATRARHARQGVALPPETLPLMLEICRTLDGLPLAIELAAARCAVLSPANIMDRLGSRLALLTQGRRSGPTRHQTLHAALTWSYDLLGPDEQRLFRRLALFAGGCTLEAVERVCNTDNDLEIAPLDGLQELVQSNLVRASTGETGEIRYTMLETIREYALTRLQENVAELHHLSNEHATYYLALARQSELAHFWFERPEQLALFERDVDNMRMALRWLLDIGAAEQSLYLASAAAEFWARCGHNGEGRQALEAALTLGKAAPPALHADVLIRLGRIATLQGDYATARSAHEAGIALCQAIGDSSGAARGLNYLGNALWPIGELAAARTLFAESLATWRVLGEARGIATGVHNLGLMLMYEKEFASARQYLEDGLQMFRDLGHAKMEATCLLNLTALATHQGDYANAWSFLEASRIIYDRFGEQLGIANCLNRAGILALHQGDYPTAISAHAESLRMYRLFGDRSRIASALEGVAAYCVTQGDFIRAVQIWGFIANMRDEANTPRLPSNQTDYDRRVNTARAELAEGAWTTAWSKGQTMKLEEAIALALGENVSYEDDAL